MSCGKERENEIKRARYHTSPPTTKTNKRVANIMNTVVPSPADSTASSSTYAESDSQTQLSVPVDRKRTNVQVQLVESSNNPLGMQLVNPERTNKVSDPMDIVELAKQVQKAEEFVRARAVGRLEVIAEQIRFLQEQAKKILKEAKRDDVLHHAACNFKKVPGNMYYLYERPSGQRYFSLLSAEEWGPSCPHEFLGAYQLEADMSWTPAANVSARSKEIDLLDRILNTKQSITDGVTDDNSKSGPVPLNEVEEVVPTVHMKDDD